MKRLLTFISALALAAICCTSCNKKDEIPSDIYSIYGTALGSQDAEIDFTFDEQYGKNVLTYSIPYADIVPGELKILKNHDKETVFNGAELGCSDPNADINKGAYIIKNAFSGKISLQIVLEENKEKRITLYLINE